MPHDTSLISTIVVGLVLAFVFGTLAVRFRQPPLVGYLLAGVMVGPHTPGFVADRQLVEQLAEIGVGLLMFGVGLQFSPGDMRAVRGISISAALAQMVVATLLGVGLGWLMGWSLGGSLVYGLALSVASTIVLLKWLQDRHLVETERGKIAIGLLVVEDLAMILALVLIPAAASLAEGSSGVRLPVATWLVTLLGAQPAMGILVGVTLLKVALFIGVMLLFGRRLVPALLHHVAHTGSRELFRLAVLVTALGIAWGAARLFGVSPALGAFFAGMVLSESKLSQRAAQETLPLRDAFAVLFFISVGMLVDPLAILRQPLALIATVLIILVGRSIAAFAVVHAFGHPPATALLVAASRAQIGEFSFILVQLAIGLGLLPPEAQPLVLAGALVTIVVNPLMVYGAERLAPVIERRLTTAAPAVLPAPPAEAVAESSGGQPPPIPEQQPEEKGAEAIAHPAPTALSGHVVLIGFGRVGSVIGEALDHAGESYLVIEAADARIVELGKRGIEGFAGNAANPDVLALAAIARARLLVIAIPDAFESGQIAAQARAANPELRIVARAHSGAEANHIASLGADVVVKAEREIARGMVRRLKLRPVGKAGTRPDAAQPDGQTGSTSTSTVSGK